MPTVINLVIDAVGIPTLEYLLDRSSNPTKLPNLERLGLGNLLDERHHSRVRPVQNPEFAHAIEQKSAEADSVVGHREMVGVIDPRRYELFFNGFPKEYIAELENIIGRKTLFNEMAGGKDAIKRNREKHEQTGYPIVYASMCDPLIQIAMHENVISVEEGHDIANIAFDLAQEMGIKITRSIARSYIVKDGKAERTANRYDRVIPLENLTLIDVFNENGIYTVSVGKPAELIPTHWERKIKLNERSQLSPELRFVHPKESDTNPYSIQGIINALQEIRGEGITGAYILANCVDTDSLWGHNQEVEGSLRSIQEIDRCLPLIIKEMSQGDVLIVTADHGMLHAGDLDYHPHLVGTQYQDYGYHSREPVPLLGMRKKEPFEGISVPTTFSDVGRVAAQILGVALKE